VQKIYTIVGNQNLRMLLAWHLQQAGYQVRQAANLAQAYRECELELPTLAIVDADLPDGEGIELCQWLYDRGDSLLLMLSARTGESDVITALAAGVDDYLKKPFGMPEFLARVAALLRRIRAQSRMPNELSFGNLRIDLVRRCVYVNSEHLGTTRSTKIDLSPQEFSLLYVLAQANGRPVHRHELLERAWDIEIDNPRTIDTHILTLRKKLGHPDPIETVRKVGYRLNY
jgi:two-component system, OmpR family, response regulator